MNISTAPENNQACMEQVLNDLNFILAYIEYILVHSTTPVAHLKHLLSVLEKIIQQDVTQNEKKCHILR